MTTVSNKESFKFQRIIAVVGVVLFLVKLYAWYKTGSVAILTDALESTINVVAGVIGLDTLYFLSLTQDHNPPYGHGKGEFLYAFFDGVLNSHSGLIALYGAIGELRSRS